MTEFNETILSDLILARAESDPDFDVLTFERLDSSHGRDRDELRTYADLAEHANRIAAFLVGVGMARGDSFGLMMRNHPEFIETMVASSRTACVQVPIDPRTRGEKLAYTLSNARCRGIVCGDYCLGQIQEIRRQVPGLEWIVVLESGENEGDVGIDDIAAAVNMGEILESPAPMIDRRWQTGADPLQIIYTSGTTGDPKGVVFPNERVGLFAMLGILLGYTKEDRPYTGLSLTHGNAQAVTLGPSLHMGLRAVFSRRFTKSRLWDISRRLGCTTFSLLGGMATAIYAEPERDNDADNPVRMVISAGMPAAIWESFARRFGVDVFEWYGAIEGGLAFKPVGVGPIGSFGKPAPGLEMKIVDENGDDCLPGAIGEIISRPMGGKAEVEYYGNEQASRDKTKGGWLRSGDMGHTDAEGWFYFDYRKGGGIRHNGDFILPSYVEKVIAEHAMVTDVFVYGIPAASGAPGEKDVVAAIVPATNVQFSAPDVFAACRAALEPNSVPGYLQIVDEIPKTASEKPQERFLFERFAPDAPNVVTEEG